jgi:hypothetical protein
MILHILQFINVNETRSRDYHSLTPQSLAMENKTGILELHMKEPLLLITIIVHLSLKKTNP